MTDYVFKYTDQTVGSFVVKPYTANGPSSPSSVTLYNNPTTGLNAISSNTPFVIVGKGVVDYGQIVQNNIIYLAENFCNKRRPAYPLKGMLWYKDVAFTDPSHLADPTTPGLYVWTGSNWNAVLINGQIAGSVDLNGNRIINVGNATSDTDALNAATANTKYLQLTGGTINGNLTIGTGGTLRTTTDPVGLSDVTNKQYVDLGTVTLQNAIDDVNTTLQSAIDDVSSQLNLAYPKTGGTISGNVSITGDLTISAGSSLVIPAGGGSVSFGARRLESVGNPVLANDAAHKAYVDDAIVAAIADIVIPTGGTTDGVVSAGALDSSTGIVTLTRTQGLSAIVVSGTFASRDHAHSADTISYDRTINQHQSEMHKASPDILTIRDAIKFLDQRMSDHSSIPVRTVITQTVGGTQTFTFPSTYEYIVWSDMLSVYMNGIKQYCNIRPDVGVSIGGAGIFSLVNVPAGTYTQDITVDSIDYTMTVSITSTTMYDDLMQQIKAEITAHSIPVVCVDDQGEGEMSIVFVTDLAGGGHTVTLGTTPTDLFTIIPTASAPIVTTEQILAYEEDGTPYAGSTSITFLTAPPVGAQIELTTYRALS